MKNPRLIRARTLLAGVALLSLAVALASTLPSAASAQQQHRQRTSNVTVDWSVLDQIARGQEPVAGAPTQARRKSANRSSTTTARAPNRSVPASRAPATPPGSDTPVVLRPPQAPPPPDTTVVTRAAPPPQPAVPATPAGPSSGSPGDFRPPTPPPAFTEQAPRATPPVAVSPNPPPPSVASSMPPAATVASGGPPAPVVEASPLPSPQPTPQPPAVAPQPAAPQLAPPQQAVPQQAGSQQAAGVPQVAAAPPVARAAQPNARIGYDGEATDFPADAPGELRGIVDQMKRSGDLRLRIEGFAGSDDANRSRRLSLSRALAIRGYLMDQGIASTRMDVFARGASADGGPANRVDVTTFRR